MPSGLQLLLLGRSHAALHISSFLISQSHSTLWSPDKMGILMSVKYLSQSKLSKVELESTEYSLA